VAVRAVERRAVREKPVSVRKEDRRGVLGGEDGTRRLLLLLSSVVGVAYTIMLEVSLL
jgi:hypothetical protein